MGGLGRRKLTRSRTCGALFPLCLLWLCTGPAILRLNIFFICLSSLSWTNLVFITLNRSEIRINRFCVRNLMVKLTAQYFQFNSYYYFQAFYLQKPENVPLSIINLMNPIIILFLVS